MVHEIQTGTETEEQVPTLDELARRQQKAARHGLKAEVLPALNGILAQHGAVASQKDVQTIFDLMERYAKA